MLLNFDVPPRYVSDGLGALAAGTAAFDSFLSSQQHSVASSLLARLDSAADGASGARAMRAAKAPPAAAEGPGRTSAPTTPLRPRRVAAPDGVLVPPATPEIDLARQTSTSTPAGGASVAASAAASAALRANAAADAARRELARLGIAAAALNRSSSSAEGIASGTFSGSAWDDALDERLIVLIDLRMRGVFLFTVTF